MVTDGMLTVSGSLQLRLGRPAINQPSTCTKFFVSEWHCSSVVLPVLLQFLYSCRAKYFFVSYAHFQQLPKKKKKKKHGKEYENGNKSACNLENTLFLQYKKCVVLLFLFHCFPCFLSLPTVCRLSVPCASFNLFDSRGFCKQVILQRCAEVGWSSGWLGQEHWG